MPAFEVQQQADHDGVRLVARPVLPVSGLAVAVAVAAVTIGMAVSGALSVAWLVPVWVVGGFLMLPLLLLRVGQRSVAVELTTRQLEVGPHRVPVHEIVRAEVVGGVVRIHTDAGAFEVGHDWPSEWQAWLVERLDDAVDQRARQLAHAGPERSPPPALQRLRERE